MPITSQASDFFVGTPSTTVTTQVPTVTTLAEISIYEYMPGSAPAFNRATAAVSQIISASGVENFAPWPSGVPVVFRRRVTSVTFATAGAGTSRIGARWMQHFYI